MCTGLECVLIQFLWVGGHCTIAQIDSYIHGEFVLGILFGKWYAIKSIQGKCVSQLLEVHVWAYHVYR